MDYKEAINFLFNQLPVYQREGKAAYKSNLDNTHELDHYFSHPHRSFKTIHVAGTNGKGSVAHMLASILQHAGYKTGLYTSPHLKDFRERIRINGEMISEEQVTKFVTDHHEIIEKVQPSFFEMTVAMAFKHFADNQVDIAIIETGLGGRLDSTNIITPLISIITNIGLDHTQFLGNSIEKIALEKAGIIKQNIPVIIGESQEEIKYIFTSRARELQAPIYFADETQRIDYSTVNIVGQQVFRLTGETKLPKELVCDQLGSYQSKNTITALKAVELLRNPDINIPNRSVYDGMRSISKTTGLMGRWQILGNNPLIVADTAHNKEGLSQVVDQISNTAWKKLHFILGAVNDKNVEDLLSLLPRDAKYYFVQAAIPRALDKYELFSKAMKLGLTGDVYDSVEKALLDAQSIAESCDMIFIGGSTFVVAEVL